MNFKGLLVAGAGAFLIYLAVNKRYAAVWKTLAGGGAAGKGAGA